MIRCEESHNALTDDEFDKEKEDVDGQEESYSS